MGRKYTGDNPKLLFLWPEWESVVGEGRKCVSSAESRLSCRTLIHLSFYTTGHFLDAAVFYTRWIFSNTLVPFLGHFWYTSFSPGIIFYEIWIETLSVVNCQSKDLKVFNVREFSSFSLGNGIRSNRYDIESGGHVWWFRSWKMSHLWGVKKYMCVTLGSYYHRGDIWLPFINIIIIWREALPPICYYVVFVRSLI